MTSRETDVPSGEARKPWRLRGAHKIPLVRWLLGPPDCDKCGAYRSGGMLGSYWHADTCPVVTTEPRYPEDK